MVVVNAMWGQLASVWDSTIWRSYLVHPIPTLIKLWAFLPALPVHKLHSLDFLLGLKRGNDEMLATEFQKESIRFHGASPWKGASNSLPHETIFE